MDKLRNSTLEALRPSHTQLSLEELMRVRCEWDFSRMFIVCNIKITYQCKIIIVPEERWFGQPKYSTPKKKKDPSTLCRLLLLFSSFYM